MKGKTILKNATVVIVALVMVLALIPGCAPPPLERPIKVGIIDSYSGPPATYCYDALDGFNWL